VSLGSFSCNSCALLCIPFLNMGSQKDIKNTFEILIYYVPWWHSFRENEESKVWNQAAGCSNDFSIQITIICCWSFSSQSCLNKRWGSSFNIVIKPWARWLWFNSQQRQEFFSLHHCVQTFWGSPQPSIHWVLGGSFCRGKAARAWSWPLATI